MNRILLFILFLPFQFAASQPKWERLQSKLDSLRQVANYPGISVAIACADGSEMTFTSGFNDKEKNIALSKSDMLMQGSVGKTYVSAIALQLVKQGKLNLEEKVATYLGDLPWYHRVPNAADITVRQIMNHSSGVMRYEFKPDFLNDLNAQPTKTWKPEELLAYVLDEKAPFAAGEGWDYSDTNYILLGMILEKLTGEKYYALLNEKILKPFGLTNTKPTNKITLPGLAQGYAGAENEFGKSDKVMNADGSFVINPQFEWTGGGVYSTTEDLARWGKLLYEGKVVDTSLMLNDAVRAKLGPDSKYGLGVIIRPTPVGVAYGHSGFFPGYLTEMAYFPSLKICIAVQANSSDFRSVKMSLSRILLELVKQYEN
ncbi:MAG TPA: serine hydrolase domain-containing protein [Chitinophagaceae bacterium]|nr:serine hydrolase domain-containing protein [Chitinophagaceae bacterium]